MDGKGGHMWLENYLTRCKFYGVGDDDDNDYYHDADDANDNDYDDGDGDDNYDEFVQEAQE